MLDDKECKKDKIGALKSIIVSYQQTKRSHCDLGDHDVKRAKSTSSLQSQISQVIYIIFFVRHPNSLL